MGTGKIILLHNLQQLATRFVRMKMQIDQCFQVMLKGKRYGSVTPRYKR